MLAEYKIPEISLFGAVIHASTLITIILLYENLYNDHKRWQKNREEIHALNAPSAVAFFGFTIACLDGRY